MRQCWEEGARKAQDLNAPLFVHHEEFFDIPLSKLHRIRSLRGFVSKEGAPHLVQEDHIPELALIASYKEELLLKLLSSVLLRPLK